MMSCDTTASWSSSSLRRHVAVFGLRQDEEADYQRRHSDDDRVPKTVEDIACRRRDECREVQHEAAEIPRAEMIRHRHRGVANASWKQFDEVGRKRSVSHADVEGEHE